MTTDKILQDVNAIFREQLDDASIRIGLDTTAADVEAWDSLTHIQLIVAIEKHFHIRFTAGEIQSFANVGDMIQRISGKLRPQ